MKIGQDLLVPVIRICMVDIQIAKMLCVLLLFRDLPDTMPASNQTTESALVSQVMKEVFGVTSDVSSVAALSSQKSSSAAAGSAAEMTAEEEEEMAGMSRLLTDEEIRKIIAAGTAGETSNPNPVPPLGNCYIAIFKVG